MRTSLEEKEAKNLAPYAIKSKQSKGRKFEEKADDERLCFQRDKDRIIHCKAFRRLDEKTQVFVAGSGDHYRTRLTHTLEVAQIARDIARRLCLNEDLCEAIALAHDLGHPPFGHAGEAALNEVMEKYDMRFEHNEQSRRVVEVLEKAYPDFDGLNLSIEVLEGMVKHQTAWDQAGKKFEVFPHLEAQAVNIADEIAYTNHDMDDGMRSGLIKLNQLEQLTLWKKGTAEVKKKYGKIKNEQVFIARTISTIIALMIDDLCRQTMANLKKFKVKSVKDIKKHRGTLSEFSGDMKEMLKELRQFLYNNFYLHPKIAAHNLRGKNMIRKLFEYYYENPDWFPKIGEQFRKGAARNDKFLIAIKDYIAGMTDRFLLKEYRASTKNKL